MCDFFGRGGPMRRLVATGLAAAVLAGGCRTPSPPVFVEPPPPPLPPAEFPVVPAKSLEPDLATLPTFDPLAAVAPRRPASGA